MPFDENLYNICHLLTLNISQQQDNYHAEVGVLQAPGFMPLYGAVTAIGAMTNLMLFMHYPKTDFKRTFRNCMVLHLALTDLAMLLIGSPTETWLTLDLYWIFNETGCRMFDS
ncbi:CRE-NPR-12 protein [Aphelenchoides avenae]|nr:CRE-NPR-12 protein [Aphelenchus avenae]